jgi:hypothetical protein
VRPEQLQVDESATRAAAAATRTQA